MNQAAYIIAKFGGVNAMALRRAQDAEHNPGVAEARFRSASALSGNS
jgi:hypothetical protein